MTISGLNPTSALPGLVPGSNLASASLGYQLPGIPLSAASSGAAERPGILTRLRSAMRSAISELRGVPSSSSLAAQTLAMQSLPSVAAPVTVKRPATAAKAKFPNAKTWKDKSGNVRELGTGRILKPAAGALAPAGNAPVVGGTQLPTNAVQTPGATVYSYDQNGNPVAPTMQQLGMTPTMLQGLEGMTGAADPSGPQLNATNQNSLGLGNGLGTGLGSAVPVLGQPILTTPAATAGTAAASTGGNQTVRNENVTDVSSNNQGVGYGSGWGAPYGGIATPGAPYGSSMMGGNAGWF